MQDFPLLPNKMKVGNKKQATTKLVYTLFNINDYCIPSKFLKQLLENDWCCLDHIHEALSMNLGPVMQSFIDAKMAK